MQQEHLNESRMSGRSATLLAPNKPLRKKPYTPPYFVMSSIAFVGFLVGAVIFLASFGGPQWYVVPQEQTVQPMTFGLWWLCVRDECVVEMTNDYMVKRYLVNPDGGMSANDVIPAYERYMVPVKVMMCFSLIFIIIAIGANLAFLAGFPTYFLESAFALGAGVLNAVGVATFGGTFRDKAHSSPFGWSFWLAVLSSAVILACGLAISYLSVLVFRKRGRRFADHKTVFGPRV